MLIRSDLDPNLSFKSQNPEGLTTVRQKVYSNCVFHYRACWYHCIRWLRSSPPLTTMKMPGLWMLFLSTYWNTLQQREEIKIRRMEWHLFKSINNLMCHTHPNSVRSLYAHRKPSFGSSEIPYFSIYFSAARNVARNVIFCFDAN